jgi:ABC-2 type transport system permease protein
MSPPRLAPLKELTLARTRIMLREPEVVFWVFLFPVLLALGLGVAFSDPSPEPIAIAVETGTPTAARVADLETHGELSVRVLSAEAAADALRRGEVALVLGGPDGRTARFDPTRPEGRVARALAELALAPGAGRGLQEEVVVQRGQRYIDWLIPGLIGFNLMSTGLWAMGFYITQTRQSRQLKRLSATPMRRSDFLGAQLLARFSFLPIEVPMLALFAWLAFGVEVEGSIWALAVVVALGALTFSALGLLAASRARTVEAASGIINVVLLPMTVLSGVFFSPARFPDAVQPLIAALPLTALNDALRAVYTDGADPRVARTRTGHPRRGMDRGKPSCWPSACFAGSEPRRARARTAPSARAEPWRPRRQWPCAKASQSSARVRPGGSRC